ncbi:hypothetical protein OSTOST_00267, partial [Ostertagia ostertagi]
EQSRYEKLLDTTVVLLSPLRVFLVDRACIGFLMGTQLKSLLKPSLSMASPPSSPVHLQIRKLPVTNEEGTSGQVLVKKPSKKIAALVGEDEMSGPPPVQSNPKNRFRNGHASFRLRMLQEQHGTGFEP